MNNIIKIKKVLIIINLFAAFLFASCGCSDDKGGSSPSNPGGLTLSISSTAETPASGNPITIIFTFNRNVTGFEPADITVTNGSAGNLIILSEAVYLAEIIPASDGDVTVSVPAGSASDVYGNGNAAADFSISYNSNLTPAGDLTLTISSPGGNPVSVNPVQVVFAFNRAVTGFDQSDISAANGSIAEFFAINESVYTAKITPASNPADIGVSVPAGSAVDANSLENTAADISIHYESNLPGKIHLTGITAEQNEITFTWTDPDDADLENIIIICSKYVNPESIALGTGTYTQAGLDPDKEYLFSINTYNANGYFSQLSFKILTAPDSAPIEYFLIYSANDLNAVRGGVTGYDGWNPEGYYLLLTDIDMEGYDYGDGYGWMPIGDEATPFNGTFLGNDHVIRNIYIDRFSENYQGLFGYVGSEARIQNIHLQDINLKGNNYSGGLAGRNEGMILNCSAAGAVAGSHNTGGLIGHNIGRVSDCHTNEQVGGTERTGGLIGYNNGNISNCNSTGVVTGTNNYAGGLIGYLGSAGSILNCYASGEVTGNNITGGLAGSNNGQISGCYSDGQISGISYTGGLIGENNGSITYSHSTSAVAGTGDYCGGLAGYNKEFISFCYVTGTVSGSNRAGGLAGVNQKDITFCYANCMVSGNEYSGGLVGMNIENATITKCFTIIAVTGNDYTGGIAGLNDTYSIIENCYATGSIAGDDFTGGLTGINGEYSSIINCFASGAVSGNNYTGGFVGSTYGTISDSFWDTETSLQPASAGGTGKTTAEMKDVITFTDTDTTGLDNPWDFADDPNDDTGTEDIWSIDPAGVINDGYPYLTNLQQ